MGYGTTAHNRSVYASPPLAARATKNRSRANALCAVFLRHIFAVAGMLRIPLSQPQNRHIQPERYVQCPLKLVKNIEKT
jgi:hypothetical protein